MFDVNVELFYGLGQAIDVGYDPIDCLERKVSN